jgi:hypothetical protein
MRESILLFDRLNKIKMDSRFRGNDGHYLSYDAGMTVTI